MTSRMVAWLVSAQVRRPLVPLVLAALVTAFFAIHAARLTLRTQYDAFLPKNAPSVIELRRLEARTSSSQTLLVLLEGSDREALHRMGDAVTAELRALGPAIVSSAEDGTQHARAFVAPRSALFLSTSELERIKRQVDERWDYEVQKADGLLLDEGVPPPPLPTPESLRHETNLVDRFPSGYFESSDGTALVVAAHSPIPGGDLPRVERALAAMHAAVDRVARRAPERASIRVSYAGDMPTAFAQYHVVLTDLLDVGVAGVALVLAVVVLYFLRARAVLVMGVTILVGLVWTFGLTQMVIGHLNAASAFLVSIVAGNGINVGILYQARFFEERARGADAPEAIRRAVIATWQPTVIAALAAAASYGSLLITDFRAFHDFGLIAAVGMLTCWVVKTLMVPPLLVFIERVMPDKRAGRPLRAFEMAYGRPFAWLAPRAPRLVLAAGAAVVVAGAIAGARYMMRDPLDYDARTLETSDPNGAELRRAWTVCNGILGASQGAIVVATDSEAEACTFADTLRARWRAAPDGKKPFAAVHALGDLVPPDQQAKIPIACELGDRLRRAHERGLVSEGDWNKLAEIVPPPNLAPFAVRDLPDDVAEPFTERNGTRGTLVLIDATPDTSNDLRSLVSFADAYRTTRLPNGKVIRGSGNAVVFADILSSVTRDVPRVILLSLALTIAVVIVTFRKRPRDLFAVLFALCAGIAGVALYLYFGSIKINFVNFAALPVTLGIGVDYAVNVAQRYVENGRRDVAAALRTSGGAVVLCSLTTLLGYIALVGSHNHAIRSLGAIAAVGEACCLVAAVVVLPALYRVIDRSPNRD
ncbi:MAG TPA: MMPL family transporter [Polyangiaceae bacterium]|nr:MMPL family transporter [Polyangiaceae bacterium]